MLSWKRCCELWKMEEKLFLLEKLQTYFEVVFSSVYFKLATGKVIFLYMCQKKSDQKGHLQLIFQLERNKEGKVGLCSRPSGYYACQLVCKWFILKSKLYTQRNTRMQHLCPMECLQMEQCIKEASFLCSVWLHLCKYV